MTDRWCPECRAYTPLHDHAAAPSLWDAVEAEHERLIEPDYAPNRVRTDDYATSKAGAISISYRAGSQKAKLLDAYNAAGSVGLTDEEAAVAAGLPMRSCWWKRCNELREAGAVVPTGEQRPGVAGVPRIVCRVAA